MSTNHYISDELLAAFIDGITTQEQNDYILEAFNVDPELLNEFKIAFSASNLVEDDSEISNNGTKDSNILPTAIIGQEMLNSFNIFNHTHINSHSSMVAASNNNHDDDRIHDLLDSISEKNNHHMGATNGNQVIGENPADLVSNEVQQQYNDTCAIKSQQLILNDFGIPVTEDQLVQQAQQLDIYRPGQGGTSPEDVGKLLEINGIPCTQHESASIYDLTSALAKGEKIIIGVDSSELWNGGVLTSLEDKFVGEQADHALIVAGIDTTNPNDVQVILTDPGTGQEGARYPIAQFIDAWQDSGNFMVTTDYPAPLAYNPEMINFDYNMGHISTIGHLSYDYYNEEIIPLSYQIGYELETTDLLRDSFLGVVKGDIDEHSLSNFDWSNIHNYITYEEPLTNVTDEQIESGDDIHLDIDDIIN